MDRLSDELSSGAIIPDAKSIWDDVLSDLITGYLDPFLNCE